MGSLRESLEELAASWENDGGERRKRANELGDCRGGLALATEASELARCAAALREALAADTGIPVVLALPAQLMQAAAGGSPDAFIPGSGPVSLRIPTLAEYREAESGSRRRLAARGISLPPSPPDAWVEARLRPLRAEYQ